MLRHYNEPALGIPSFPGSHLVMDDHYVYLSGLTAADLPDGAATLGDIREETHQIMEHLARLLAHAECTLDDSVRVDVHLTDLALQPDFDAVYARWFSAPFYPARTCTVSPQLAGGASVEVTLVARRQPQR
ncbi:reactive intermediate/imine deaminase [Halomonas cupida]|uniref:2-iminobutanoate/2-iminopropanoate deaminase n=1 Tax=Halomonas cupida TaxID=44933 RepID=A0A1M7ACM6_9GAMM|nr:RidA family protein [Halomonas cupida]GEN22437.1 reactive intermediate/imine deaminase [Halomonas cupida]SHL40454.1 2-iminobutanoate/2-iminopropanoate deaminase [Halomonas cupida]